MIRLTDPLDLRTLAPSLLEQLRPLTVPGRRFDELLRDRPESLVVIALDATGAIGWSTAQPDGVIGVFIHAKHRRHGLGRRLVEAVEAAGALAWPGVAWMAMARPGSPGRAFFDRVWGRSA